MGFDTSDGWVFLSTIEQAIKTKIERNGIPIKDWGVNIYRGILTGLNEAFIVSGEQKDALISEDPKSAEIIRPILRGRDIKRYGYEFADLWLISTFPSRHYNIDDFPAVKKHLLSFGIERLEQSGKKYLKNGGQISARKRTANKWFETQDSISYWNELNMQKICWIELSDESKFAIVDELVPLNTVFFMNGKHLLYLLGALNSRVINWYFRHCLGTKSGVGTNRWLKYTVEQLPIPVPDEYGEIESYVKEISEEKIEHYLCNLYGLTDEEEKYILLG